MSVLKKYKLANKALADQQRNIADLDGLAKSVERCEQTIKDLKVELERVNLKHQNRKTTQDDVAYLTDLLRCANKKLGWEKQIASLKKRTPTVLEEMTKHLHDPNNPPQEEMRAAMLRTLQRVQLALERLEKFKAETGEQVQTDRLKAS